MRTPVVYAVCVCVLTPEPFAVTRCFVIPTIHNVINKPAVSDRYISFEIYCSARHEFTRNEDSSAFSHKRIGAYVL